MNDNKSPMEKFFAGKGFYIALALCVAGTGTAAWMAVNRTIDDIDRNNQNILNSQIQQDFTDPEEVGKDQSGVSISSGEQQDSLNSSSSSSQSAKPSGSTASSVPQNESALQFTLPVAGEKINPYSEGKLVKDKTLGEWRTHDGVDLKAAKGTPVYAAAEGTVTSVETDGLWGTVVKIEHRNGLTTVYSGLDKNALGKKGDEVAAREQIGTVAQVPCELALEEHLHFAVQKDGKWLDPLKSIGLA